MFRNALMRGLRAPLAARQSALPRVGAVYAPANVRFYAGFPALTRDGAKERILELLEGYDKVDTSKEITEQSSFVQDLGLDSLDVVEVVMEVEHEFNIQIPDNEADNLKTVGQTLDYILAQDDAC
ncbi:mitochondrial acyl carrier protein [Suhomyces tanzawaensis NRRL Y-17324]|uniref:Acyl carrier protein n=1 Tax=Suhomyces tanzawaensis NRRL Y-17324 TaxID=984487 RepID=A0A1E4SPC0_9ASCO|nr:mitochondrial acyl carrier protein [Suhomyces tanzawaensis NRRL Y-17324]ODV81380.1 mitochondrial acyl carrier protein [Suhomyces tanzawaensis NRRL Y-17324]